MRKKSLSVKELVFMALYAALFVVLDYVSGITPFLQMPNGGSIGFGTIALLMASYHLGWKRGLLVAIVSLPLQFISGVVYYAGITGYMLDYVIAFGIYGIASLFPNYNYFYSGVLITNVIRLISSTISGTIVYGLTWQGSLAYNGPYMIATCVVGMIMVPLLHRSLKPIIGK